MERWRLARAKLSAAGAHYRIASGAQDRGRADSGLYGADHQGNRALLDFGLYRAHENRLHLVERDLRAARGLRPRGRWLFRAVLAFIARGAQARDAAEGARRAELITIGPSTTQKMMFFA